MHVRFSCGTQGTVSPSVTERPVCGCAESHPIVRVSAPPPSIRGVCSGPMVTTVALAPIAVNLCQAGHGPLPVPVDPSQEPAPKPRSLRKVN